MLAALPRSCTFEHCVNWPYEAASQEKDLCGVFSGGMCTEPCAQISNPIFIVHGAYYLRDIFLFQ